MPFIGLTPYSIRVREKNSRGSFCDLRKFDGKTDLVDLLHGFLKSNGIKPIASSANKHFEILAPTKLKRSIYGIVELGNSGYSSKIKDVKTGTVGYARKKTDSEFVPLFYRFEGDTGSNDLSILTLQNFEHFGLASALNEYIKLSFKKLYPDHSIYIQRLLVPDLAQKLINASPIPKARWIRKKIPKDIADRLGAAQFETGELEVVIRGSEGNPFGIRRRVAEYFSGASSLDQLLEVDDIKFEQLKLEIEVNGKKRTVSMHKADNLNNTFDVTETVEIDSTGHPKLTSINALAAELAADLLGKGAK